VKRCENERKKPKTVGIKNMRG